MYPSHTSSSTVTTMINVIWAPLFANVFMGAFERKHMSRLNELGVKHWWRYVDDIFASVSNKEEANTILEYINQQHPNIKFTVEHELNKF